MPYNFADDSFHTKKLWSRLSSSEVRFQRKNDRFAFLNPLIGLRGNVQPIGKRVVDFVLVLIELFR